MTDDGYELGDIKRVQGGLPGARVSRIPSWVYERPGDDRDEWKPDDAADEASARFERDHSGWDQNERAA